MFYEKQPLEKVQAYRMMLSAVTRLSRLFSEGDKPYLPYRAHENIFSSAFGMVNNSRADNSADAYSVELGIGVGLKTWVGSNLQKVAEFGKLRPKYAGLDGIELARQISEYRNIRISATKALHEIEQLIYHVVKRESNTLIVYETPFDEIDIENLRLLPKRGGDNSLYFTDGKHTYNFSKSKNTLYMDFSNMEELDRIRVDILDDPFASLLDGMPQFESLRKYVPASLEKPQLCLRLYSFSKRKGRHIPDKSGLNQWNGARRTIDYSTGVEVVKKETPRNPNEAYIPYHKIDRERGDFFPPRNVPFDLVLPNGKIVSAKVCQDSGKAIMTNPNSLLGQWLLREVFKLPYDTVVTYEMLVQFGIDSVLFTKLDETKYKIEFCPIGTYEKFYGDWEE